MNKKKIGFFGGCFNPVTIAHINLIKETIEKCELDKVYFVPMGDFYLKPELIPAKYRYEMLKLALEKEDKIDVSKIVIDSNKPTTAIDTFEIINKKFNNSDNYFIMGSDNFHKISEWKSSEKLKNDYNYIILDRDEIGNKLFYNRKYNEKSYDRKNEKYQIISDEAMKNISSSLVRNKIKQNEDYNDLVPKEIKDYIEKNNLYKGEI